MNTPLIKTKKPIETFFDKITKKVILPHPPDKIVENIYVAHEEKKVAAKVEQTQQSLMMDDFTLYEFSSGEGVAAQIFGFGLMLQRQYYLLGSIVTIYKMGRITNKSATLIVKNNDKLQIIGAERFYLEKPYEHKRLLIGLERLKDGDYAYLKHDFIDNRRSFYDNA